MDPKPKQFLSSKQQTTLDTKTNPTHWFQIHPPSMNWNKNLSIFIFQLLSKPKFSLVEKIKTIGSSYMVAAGLTPGVQSVDRLHVIINFGQTFVLNFLNRSNISFQISREQHFAVILIEFAHQLMVLLDQINKESFQVSTRT